MKITVGPKPFDPTLAGNGLEKDDYTLNIAPIPELAEGTYNKVSVNTLGQVTSASAETTMEGLGISGTVEDISDITISADKINSLKYYHGFKTLPDAPTFSGTTLTVPGTTPYSVYIDGKESLIETQKTLDLSSLAEWGVTPEDNYGQWFVWINSDLSLGASQTTFNVLDVTKISLVTLYLQSDGGTGYNCAISRDWRDYRRNLIEQKNQHESWGAQYVSGFTSLTIGGGSPTVNTFSLAGGVFRSEDLHHTISNPQTSCHVAYRNSTLDLLVFDNADTGYSKIVGGVPVYDNAGTLTGLGNNKYGVQWVYASARLANPIISVIGQAEYSSIAEAQAAGQPSLPGFGQIEAKLLYKVIIQNKNAGLLWVQTVPLYNVSTGPAISGGALSSIAAGNVSYLPTTPDTSADVQTALDERALLAGSSSQDFATQNLSVSKTASFTVGTVAAGATITIPNDYTIVNITDDSASAANSLTMPSGAAGQILWIYNGDAQATSGAFIIPSGYIGMFIYINGWKLLRGIVG